VVGTPTVVFKPQPATITQDDINAEIANKLDTESRFKSNVTGTDLIEDTPDEEDLEMHLNLYAFIDGEASLVHALKKPQKNTRFGNWRRNSYPLGKYLDGSLLASDTYDEKSPLINIGNAMMPSDFKIFTGSSTVNSPPKAGQPHSVLGYWNIRNQESFSRSTNWADSFKPSSWLNAFSFRDVPIFKDTWETTDSLFSNLSMDRLGGWRLSNVPNMSYPFFDYPAGTYGPLSLGSFQHANLSPYGWHPTFAFGNAQAEPRMEREFFQSSLNPDIYDLSYLLNASVWDRYYLSTIPQDGVTLVEKMRLPNSRMSLADGSEGLDFDAANLVNDRGFDFSAAHVLIHGGFNVNSTSHTAWKAFLSGAIGQTVETQHNSVDSHIETAAGMGRFLNPLVEEPDAVANDRTTTDFETVQGWASTRTLSEDEIDTLSKRIVEEVKRRGPFLSLADFVNRRLQASNGASGDEKTYQEILGTLQAAINKATIEDQVINSHYYTGNVNQMKIDPSSSGGEWDSISFSVTDSAKEAMFGYPLSEISSNGGLLHNYAPGFLSQADVLTKIGPRLGAKRLCNAPPNR